MKKEIPKRTFNQREVKEQLYMGVYMIIGQSLKGNREMKSNQFLLNQMQQLATTSKYEWYDSSVKLMSRLKMYLISKEDRFNLKDAVSLKISLLRFILAMIVIEDSLVMKQVDEFLN